MLGRTSQWWSILWSKFPDLERISIHFPKPNGSERDMCSKIAYLVNGKPKGLTRPLGDFAPCVKPLCEFEANNIWVWNLEVFIETKNILRPPFFLKLTSFLFRILFAWWCYLSYVHGFWRLNLCLSWFWWRHLDAGLHAVMHGDFRSSRRIQGGAADFRHVDW